MFIIRVGLSNSDIEIKTVKQFKEAKRYTQVQKTAHKTHSIVFMRYCLLSRWLSEMQKPNQSMGVVCNLLNYKEA